MEEGKEHESEVSLDFIYSHSKGNGNVCNDTTFSNPEPEPKSVTLAQPNVQNFADTSNVLDSL